MPAERQEQYYQLIDELMRCPNGEEPTILNREIHLVDEGLIKTMIQVGTMMAHENNPDGAQFLFFMARQLAKNLELV